MVIDPNDLSGFDRTPDETLYGLSQRDFFALCHFPFMKASPMKIRSAISDDVLDRLPFFRMCEALLAIVARNSSLKLTSNGNLPIAIVKEVYANGTLRDPLVEMGLIKSFREQEIIAIVAAREVCSLAGLIKKRKNQLTLTKKGQKLRGNRYALMSKILIAHGYDFFTAQFDGYPDHATGEYGSHVVWYLLMRYGWQSRTSRYYGEKYLSLFPELITSFSDSHTPAAEQFYHCFEVRTFTRFNDWWGFTETTEARYGEIAMTKQTELLISVLEFIRNG